MLPWYNFALINFLEGFLKPEHTVFEYGGGNSTIYYSNKVRLVNTTETRKEWLDFIKTHQIKQNIDARLCLDIPNFANSICNFGELKYNIIVVDSRDRAKCLEESTKHLAKNGIIILDNSERSNLQNAISCTIKKSFNVYMFSGIRADGASSTASVFTTSSC